MESYNPNYKYLSFIKISEIVFSEDTDLTLMCKVPNREFHYMEFWNIFCDYSILTEILLYVGDDGDPIITKLTDILSSTFIEKPTVIDIKNILGQELIVDGLTLKVYKPQSKGDDGIWKEDPNDNCLEIDSIVFNNNAQSEFKNSKKYIHLLNDYYILLDNSFNYYLQLINKGFSIEESRNRCGLNDELLYRIAIARNAIK
jgi:hypothetical protein